VELFVDRRRGRGEEEKEEKEKIGTRRDSETEVRFCDEISAEKAEKTRKK